MRDRFWYELMELYDTCRYYQYYKEHCRRIDNKLSGFLMIVSASGIAGWAMWNNVPLLWSVIIGLSQVFSIIKPLVPYSKRVTALTYILPDLQSILNRMQREWDLKLLHDTLNNNETSELLTNFKNEIDTLDNKFLGNIDLPLLKKCLAKAEDDRKAFVSANYPAQCSK